MKTSADVRVIVESRKYHASYDSAKAVPFGQFGELTVETVTHIVPGLR